MVESFASRAAPGFKLSRPFATPHGKLDASALKLAEAIGHQAYSLPILEACYYLTGLYTALLPAHHRGTLGAFYTPPALANRLLDLATEAGVDWTTARVLDPASGGGAFLLPVAQRMREALADCDPALTLAQIGNRLLGLELDPHAAGLAQAMLDILLADLAMACGRPVPTLVRVADTLEEAPSETYDLIIGNPPYGRVALTADQRQRYARSLYGHANLYGVFTDIALRWAKPDGIIAYLTPTSFLGGHYYSALRALLAADAPPLAIDFVQARRGVFEDVLQETLLALYKRNAPKTRAQVHYLTIVDEREAQVVCNGTIGLPDDAKAPWLAPREPKHSALIARVESMPNRLADLGYAVSTGPLVWNRFKKQLRQKPGGQATHPLIWAECVTADGQFIFRAEKRNHEPYFKLESGDAWLLVQDPGVLIQRTTSKEQARRLIAAELPSTFVKTHGGVVVENHLNMIRATVSPKVTPAVLAALFNSDVVDQVFRCISGSVAVSAFELEALPLPAPEALEVLGQLVKSGANKVKIEAECRHLYGEGA
jgi:adenine-specific DNA-methyltransferase